MDAEQLQKLLNDNLYAGDVHIYISSYFKAHTPALFPFICQIWSMFFFLSDLSGHSQKTSGFSLDLCKSMVALMDVSSTIKDQGEKRLVRVV